MTYKDKLNATLIASDLYGTSHADELIKLFDELLGELDDVKAQAEDDAMWRSGLENGGVDNWKWYSESLSDYFEWCEENDR